MFYTKREFPLSEEFVKDVSLRGPEKVLLSIVQKGFWRRGSTIGFFPFLGSDLFARHLARARAASPRTEDQASGRRAREGGGPAESGSWDPGPWGDNFLGLFRNGGSAEAAPPLRLRLVIARTNGACLVPDEHRGGGDPRGASRRRGGAGWAEIPLPSTRFEFKSGAERSAVGGCFTCTGKVQVESKVRSLQTKIGPTVTNYFGWHLLKPSPSRLRYWPRNSKVVAVTQGQRWLIVFLFWSDTVS